LSRERGNPLLLKKKQSSDIVSVLLSIWQGQRLEEAKDKPKDLSQYNKSKHKQVSILKRKLEWLLPQDKKLESLESRLEARKELTRVKRASLLPLYILSN
jgi:hypothetical protein